MKKHFVILFLFVATKIFPQQINTPPTEPLRTNDQPVQQNISKVDMRNGVKAEKFKNLKIGGIVLLSAGGIGLISGIAIVSSGVSNQISTTNTYSTSSQPQPISPANASKIVGGVYLGVFGAFAIGGGTVMAIIGSHKQKKYAAASRLSVVVTPTAFRIAYKF